MSNYTNNYNSQAVNRRPYFTLPEALRGFIKNYAKFDGRASRSEYWWVQLTLSIVSFIFLIGIFATGINYSTIETGSCSEEGGSCSSISTSADMNGFGVMLLILGGILCLALIIPNISLTVRRLHDANFSGWLYLINFIPWVGSIALLVMNILDSKPEGARYDGAVQPWLPENKNMNTPQNYNGDGSGLNSNPYPTNSTNNFPVNGGVNYGATDNYGGNYQPQGQQPYPAPEANTPTSGNYNVSEGYGNASSNNVDDSGNGGQQPYPTNNN